MGGLTSKLLAITLFLFSLFPFYVHVEHNSIIIFLLINCLLVFADMVKNKGFLPSGPSEIPIQRNQMKEIIYSLLPACKEPDMDTHVPFKADAIIANPPAYGQINLSMLNLLSCWIHYISSIWWNKFWFKDPNSWTHIQPQIWILNEKNSWYLDLSR